MSRHRRKQFGSENSGRSMPDGNELQREYDLAASAIERGQYSDAKSRYDKLRGRAIEPKLRALVENDLGVLEVFRGNLGQAQAQFLSALTIDPACNVATQNLQQLVAPKDPGSIDQPENARSTRIAILSMLFNWPSTGGGTIHTAELGVFLARAGYTVRHFYADYAPWGVGKVTEPTGVDSVALAFTADNWSEEGIKNRFRIAVDGFAPDFVILTDSWNTKPLLAEAVQGYRYFIRLAALECLCPLNNVRMLLDRDGICTPCPKQQLATPDACVACVRSREDQCGPLHRAERNLAGFGRPEYSQRLQKAFANAEGVLVVNPLAAAMVSPFARAVHVVPSGFDPDRFPVPNVASAKSRPRVRLFFAGLVPEYMKGFHILKAACERLWQRRQDFELFATGDPPGSQDAYTTFVGWQSQESLPHHLAEADILVFPTIAEEALGRSAVEAMAVGLPVIASRIGGLPFTVSDGGSGLLFTPGDASDLADKIEILLNRPELRRQMGAVGRERFEREFTWTTIIDRHYRQLFPSATPAPNCSRPAYAPDFPEFVDHQQLIADTAEFFRLPLADVERMFHSYQTFHESKCYAQTLGEQKTLTFEESFVVGSLMSIARPAVIVEIGTQHGKSTRRIVDLAHLLGITSRIICFDVVDLPKRVASDEVEFHCIDLTGRFRQEVLDRFGGGLIYVDMHAPELLREVIRETRGHYGNWILAIHDCGPGLCNPHMTISASDEVTSLTGVWERHILAETFGVEDPLSNELDRQQAGQHRLRIFPTQHGLAVLLREESTSFNPASEITTSELTAHPS